MPPTTLPGARFSSHKSHNGIEFAHILMGDANEPDLLNIHTITNTDRYYMLMEQLSGWRGKAKRNRGQGVNKNLKQIYRNINSKQRTSTDTQ